MTLEAPIRIDSNLAAAAFVTYSALLGEYRNHHFRDLRAVYRGTAGGPAAYADTVWGGIRFSLNF